MEGLLGRAQATDRVWQRVTPTEPREGGVSRSPRTGQRAVMSLADRAGVHSEQRGGERVTDSRPSWTSGPLLRIDGLTKRYPGTTALDDLTVEVPRGRIGLVGANGAGKTTTFRLLLGLAHPTEGRIEVCGIDVARDPIGVRARLGYMPEHDCLPLDQTAADVVSTFGELSGLPARAARQRASDILDLVGLDEARFRPIGEFSTGMRQRTKLAQAIVGDPELVLLDEPTAGLDPLGREDMLALVARLGSFGISVLMATHLLDDVQQVCDHVVMIDARPARRRGRDRLAARAHRHRHRRRRPAPRRARRRARRGAACRRSPPTASSRSTIDGDERPRPAARRHRRARAPALPPLDPPHVARRSVPAPRRGRRRERRRGRTRRRGLRPRLPPVRRPARPAGRGDVRAVQGVDAARARASGGRGARRSRRSCCSASSRSRRSSTSASATSRATASSTERIEIITYREYVGVSSALLLFVALVAPDVICPDRRQHVLPLMFARPLTGVDYVVAKVGAIATILFAFSFLPQVVLFVGNMLVSDSALDYFTGHLDVLWKVPLAVAAARRLLRRDRRRDLVAHRPPHRRGRVDHRAVPRHVDRVGRSSSATTEFNGGSAAALINVLALPLYLRDLVFLGHIDRESPLNGVANGGLLAIVVVRRRAARRRRACCCAATAGWNADDRARARPDAADDPAFAPTRPSRSTTCRCGSGQKVALSELSCSFGPGVTGLLGPNGAGKTTLMRAITGLIDVNQGTVRDRRQRPAPRPRGVPPPGAVPEDEAVPAGLTARQFVRYVADLHGVADRDAPDDALRSVGMLDVADRRVDAFSKGMRQRTKVAAALVSDPHVLVLDEPLNGADPVQRAAPHRAVQAARRARAAP